MRFALLMLMITLGCDSPAPAPPPMPSEPVQERPRPQVVLPGGNVIDVEVSADDELRAQGLMYRESLPRGKGMIFLFPQTGLYPFWMKNTMIPLDIIWIDESGTVVYIERSAPPCRADPCPSYSPGKQARYVLELQGGDAAHYGLDVGSRVEMRNLEGYTAR